MACVICAPSGKHAPHMCNSNINLFRTTGNHGHLSHTGCTQQLLRLAQIPHTICMTHVPPTLQLITVKKTWFLTMTTQEMRVHLSAHDKSPRQDKESTPPKFEPQPLRVEVPVVYGRKSATHESCLGPTSQNRRAETSFSRWDCASRDRPERPRNIEENCEHVEHRQTIRNSTDNINWCSFERTVPSNTKLILCPTSPSLGCLVILRGVPSASHTHAVS